MPATRPGGRGAAGSARAGGRAGAAAWRRRGVGGAGGWRAGGGRRGAGAATARPGSAADGASTGTAGRGPDEVGRGHCFSLRWSDRTPGRARRDRVWDDRAPVGGKANREDHARDPAPHQALRPRHRARRRHLHGPPRPARRLPRPERRRQDDDDALHLRPRHARTAATCAGTARRRRAGPPALRLHARAARPLPADARRGAARLLRPAPRPHGARRAHPRRRWLERFGLADRAKSKLEDLSHGNQQRVQLATALVHDPELLVLDEPFSGLDPIGIATMSEVLRERAAAGVGVVFSSHQLDLVEEVCEDVVIISRGPGRRRGRDRRPQGRVRTAAPRGRGRRLGRRLARRPRRPTTRLLERGGDRVKLLVDEGVDLDALLAAAQAAGEVRRFSFEPPRLSELFMEAVTAPQPSAAEGVR